MNQDKKPVSYLHPIMGAIVDYKTLFQRVVADSGISSSDIFGTKLNSVQEIKLFPYFQPIVEVASGNIVGYEALARQMDANGRITSAGALFSAENIPDGQLIEWDRSVRRQALGQFINSNCNGYLTINISAAWIDYVADFNELPTLQMLEECNIHKGRIIIEITESKGDLNKLVEIADVYRKHGLKIAIDDFGAGFSQLERLMAIQPDIIKLDMQLFKQATKGGIARDIVYLLTRLAKRTGCRIVCEGVETEEEFFFGLSCGAQYMQGYLFSPAEAEFKHRTHFQEQIGALRKSFISNNLSKERRKIQYRSKIKRLCNRLKKTLEDGLNLNELSVYPFQESGVLRFYLCNADGEQVSSNYNIADGKWFEDTTKIGFNWAWRPYFYQLLALKSVKNNPLLASERYRDFNSDVLCKTLSTRLSDERVLLIDIVAG